MSNQSVQAAVTKCKSFPENPENCDIITFVRRAVGAFSCISCMLVIFMIWVHRRYTAFSQDSGNEHITWCRIQGFLVNYFNYTVMTWICCINVNIAIIVVKDVTIQRFEKVCHGVCWLASLLVCLLPFIGDHYGPSGSWCWIVPNDAWRFGVWYGPLYVVSILLLLLYGIVFWSLYRREYVGSSGPSSEMSKALRKELRRLRLYPFVFLLLWVIPFINRIFHAHGKKLFPLELFHSMSASLQGAAFSFVFILDKRNLRTLRPSVLKEAIQRKCCRRQEVSTIESVRSGNAMGIVNPAVGSQVDSVNSGYEETNGNLTNVNSGYEETNGNLTNVSKDHGEINGNPTGSRVDNISNDHGEIIGNPIGNQVDNVSNDHGEKNPTGSRVDVSNDHGETTANSTGSRVDVSNDHGETTGNPTGNQVENEAHDAALADPSAEARRENKAQTVHPDFTLETDPGENNTHSSPQHD